LSWYASGFHDWSVIDESNYRWYGGLFNVPVQLIHPITGHGLYETSHVATVLLGLSGVGLAYWVGRELGGGLAGLLSAVFLWLTPIYYGHSFNNPKDLPFAVLILASVAVIMSGWPYLPQLPRRVWVRIGLVVGMTFGVRWAGWSSFSVSASSGWRGWSVA